MHLKRIVDNLEQVEEKYRDLYKKEADGKYHLQADEDPEQKAKLDEFRQNNIKLAKDLKTVQDTLAGIDLEEYKELKKTSQGIKDQQLIAAGKIDEVVAERTARMKSDFEAQLKAIQKSLEDTTKERDTLSGKYATELIEGRVMRAITTLAVPRKEAVADILNRARNTFTLENGELTPKTDGKILYGKDGKSPLSIEEYAQNLVTDGPHLFESTAGGGAQGSQKGGGGSRGTGKIDEATWKNMSPGEKLKAGRAQAQGGK